MRYNQEGILYYIFDIMNEWMDVTQNNLIYKI